MREISPYLRADGGILYVFTTATNCSDQLRFLIAWQSQVAQVW
jgi:hypothetical protein